MNDITTISPAAAAKITSALERELMTVQPERVPADNLSQGEIDSRERLILAARGMAAMEDMAVELNNLRAQRDTLEQSNRLLEHENGSLRKDLAGARARGDHFFRCYTALKAKIGIIISGIHGQADVLTEAVKMTEVESMGEGNLTERGALEGRRPRSEVQRQRETA
jgi:hypothetical protein